MNAASAAVSRILVVHPEPAQRQNLEQTLRRVVDGPATVYQAASPAAGLEAARRLEPSVVLLDLEAERSLALEIARETRRPDRLLIGLYNPLLLPDAQAASFFRQAARAGIADFVPLPAGEAELKAALAAADGRHETRTTAGEGRLVVFVSPKGGVGTTTLAASVALSLVASGTVDGGVALCDAAVPFGTAAALLGVAPNRDLADLVRDLDDLKALGSYLTSEERSHLALLAAPRDPYSAQEITPEQLGRALILLRRRFARVVVDGPAGLDLMGLAAIDLAERVYVITEAWTPTVLATARFLRLLEEQELGGDRLRLVLNRYSDQEDLSADLVAEQAGRPLDFVVPFEPEVLQAGNRGEPVVLTRPDGPFARAAAGIAEDVAAFSASAAG